MLLGRIPESLYYAMDAIEALDAAAQRARVLDLGVSFGGAVALGSSGAAGDGARSLVREGPLKKLNRDGPVTCAVFSCRPVGDAMLTVGSR